MLRPTLFALAAVTAAACTELVDSDASDENDGTGKGDGPSSQGDPEAVARGKEWVDAKVPYCQAPNHEHDNDADCAMTCTRPDNPDWDPYRSDCAGFVSWAWGQPPPGRTTATLAPFDTEVSYAIDAVKLLPGDAINNNHHTMLFVEWLIPGKKARFYEEAGCSTSQPYAREYISTIASTSGHTLMLTYRGTYTAIRQTR
jgi:hypothetical protein